MKVFYKNCVVCNKLFIKNSQASKFCSIECRQPKFVPIPFNYCKICDTSHVKENPLKLNIQNRNIITYTDDTGRRWRSGHICSRFNDKPLKTVNCIKCNKEILTKTSCTKYCSKQCKPKIKKLYKKKIHFKDVKCLVCSNTFKSGSARKYCSSSCQKLNKPKKIKRTAVEKNCLQCNTIFKTTTRTQFCSVPCQVKRYKIKCKLLGKKIKSNSPTAKEAKRLRRRARDKIIMQRKLKWCSWKEINDFIKTRPSRDFHLDHIVPLNHPLVSGLHIPANFQWLPSRQNENKSNLFDTTQNYIHWIP